MLLIIAIVSNLVAKIPFSFNTTTIFSKKLSKTHLISPFHPLIMTNHRCLLPPCLNICPRWKLDKFEDYSDASHFPHCTNPSPYRPSSRQSHPPVVIRVILISVNVARCHLHPTRSQEAILDALLQRVSQRSPK